MLNVSWFSRLGRPFLSRHSATDLAQPGAPDLLAEFPRYFALRSIEDRLSRELIETLPEAAFEKSTRILGLRIDDTERTNFNAESMIVEHALFHYRWDGLNAVELRARDRPPPQESLEAKWLCGLLASYYTIGIVRRRLPRFGAELVDVFSEEERLVGDLAFGSTASVGSVVAARLIPVDELWMISASSLAVIDEPRVLHQMREYCKRRFPNLRDVRELDAAEAFEFQTQLIRLVASYGSHTVLFSMGDEAQKLLRAALPEPTPAATPRRRKIGRNDPCPCGSGAKYKRCCGRGIR